MPSLKSLFVTQCAHDVSFDHSIPDDGDFLLCRHQNIWLYLKVLLMFVLIIGGVFTAPSLDKQFFPTAEINEVSVTMALPGAGPAEGGDVVSESRWR